MVQREKNSALHVAVYVLKKASEQGRELTPMQVIKLVYLCHGWMLGLYGRTLFRDHAEAWPYGPVIPEVYDAVREFRADPVEIEKLSQHAGEQSRNFDEDEKSIMDQVVQTYGHLSGIRLSTLTHAEGTPWHETRNMGRNGRKVISNNLITEHFQRIAEREQRQQAVAANA